MGLQKHMTLKLTKLLKQPYNLKKDWKIFLCLLVNSGNWTLQLYVSQLEKHNRMCERNYNFSSEHYSAGCFF